MNRLKNNSLLLMVFLLFYGGTALGQYSKEFNKYKAVYPEERKVRLVQETTITIDLEDDILIEETIHEEDIFLDDSATYGSKRSVSYNTFNLLKEIAASSYFYDDGSYEEIEVTAFNKKDEIDNSFYDDTQSVNFIFPKITKGSKTKLSYTNLIKNPRFLGSFYLADFTTILRNTFTIIADKDVQLEFKEFNTEGLNVSFTQSEKRGKIIYKWEVLNTPKYKSEPNVPTYSNILPHIVPIVRSYTIDGQTTEILGDVNRLYNWYDSLTKDLNDEPANEELVALTQSLIKDKETAFEKVKAIYYWTQQNIQYIDFEYALGGFVPREANDVFSKKFGDCKDNSSILMEMLEIAGIEGNLTWIGTRSIPYKYTDLATPIVDNHMILSFQDGDQIFYLDATGRYMPIDLPTPFIQGKEALIGYGNGNFEIKDVPVISSDKSSISETSNLSINNDTLIGSSNASMTGYTKADMFRYLENVDNKDDAISLYGSVFQKGGNKFIISDLNETNKYSYDEPFLVDYKFTVQDYITSFKDEIYVNLNLNKILSEYIVEEDRKYDIDLEYKERYVHKNILAIPEGYTVDYLPEDYDNQNELASVSIRYQKSDNQIEYIQDISLNYLTITPSQQKQLNDLIRKTEKAYKEVVVFKKI